MKLNEIKQLIESHSRIPQGMADTFEDVPEWVWRGKDNIMTLTEEDDGEIWIHFNSLKTGPSFFVNPTKQVVESAMDLFLGETKS